MASKSRTAQETLAELEKCSAPFEDQLGEAWKFIGVDPEIVGRSGTEEYGPEKESQGPSTHGREEWLLRWLLKKLQAPKDEMPRKTALSWKLLSYLIQTIPITNSAPILSERKFITILRMALQEAQNSATRVPAADGPEEPSSEDESLSRSSKKRKRSAQVAVSTSRNGTSLRDLLQAIHGALGHISKATKVALDAASGYRSTAFAAEYMKTVIATTAEESAQILGSWLSLSRSVFQRTGSMDSKVWSNWLSPFVEVWEVHTSGSEDLMQFSLHCSQSLLSLLRIVRESASPDWASELEQLVACNIIIPAKIAKADNAGSDLLNTLTRVSIIQESSNATVLLDVAIRSLQPTMSGRRRPQDDTWLQTVFTTLRDAMPPIRAEPNGKAIQGMLQSAIDYKVAFDLSILRAVAQEFALSGKTPDWALLSTLIKLDANAFLIPNEDKNLLQEVLSGITTASLSSTWSEIYQQVVADVLIPLMREFAKARDLSGFIRHWYAQLAEFERLRTEARLFSMVLFSAWEDDALQSELSKLLEPSLTVTQIIHLLDWLSAEVKVNPNAVCVILEAIAGSIDREDVIDAVGLQLYHIMFDHEASQTLDGRYKWRSWRLLSRLLSWIQADELEEISRLWEENRRPFASINSKIGISGLLEIVDGNTAELETLEVLKFTCTAWSLAEEGSRLQNLVKKPLLNFLQALARDVKVFPQDLKSGQELGEEKCGSNFSTLYRGIGWMMWSFVRCILVEHPKVLQLGLSLDGSTFKEMIQSIFLVPSSAKSSSKSGWLQINPDGFPNLWKASLADEFVQNSWELTDLMMDTMISSMTTGDNAPLNPPMINSLAIKSLLEVPLEKFTKRDRERIMKSWLPDPENEDAKDFAYESIALDPQLLSLKVKIMGLPTFYEGMKFSDLVYLAGALSGSKSGNLNVNLGLFKDLARLTLFHLTANLDQARNKEYASEAFATLKKKTKSKKSEDKKSMAAWDFAMVALFEVVITALNTKAAALNDLDIVSNKDLTKVAEKFKSSLTEQLHNLLKKPEKSKKTDQGDHKVLFLVSLTDALETLGIDESASAELVMDAKTFIASLKGEQQEAGSRVERLLWVHLHENSVTSNSRDGISTVYGRRSIKEKVQALAVGKNQGEKLEWLNTIAGPPSPLDELDRLFAARSLIISCEDSRRSADEDSAEDFFDLSSAYAELCSQLWKTDGYRQFALVGETMEMMLRTKGRAISQWNIDSTLGSISILCSRKAPSLRSLRSGSIYIHLCRLLQATVTSHRLKLQGHFHLVVQSMQALLRCLFTPLPHSTSKITKIFAPPPWLSEPKHQLRAKHAEAYTRLVTLICDPSVSSVTRSQQNNLTSATDGAKRMAGQHMQYVLTLYIKLQLEMKMLPEVREKMIPGIYAIFDTTTPELRRGISEGLDSSGRAVFGTLYRDYSRFGKWKGS